VSGVQNSHGYTHNAQDTVTAVLSAGMDTDCGGYMGSNTMGPLLSNKTIAALADTALNHLFTVQMRLGFADKRAAVPWGAYGAEVGPTRHSR